MIHIIYNNLKLISKDNFKCFNRQGRFFLSPKFKAFESSIAIITHLQHKGAGMLTGDLEMWINAYYRNKVHIDAGNCPKSVCDSLQDILFANDKQIKKLTVEIFEGADTDWFEIYVCERKG